MATHNQSPSSPITPSRQHSDSNVTISIASKKIWKTEFPRFHQGHWTKEEHDIYLNFLEEHRENTIQNQLNKKNNKIFKLMAMTIGTRSPSQCRSHHQKFNPFTAQGQKRQNRGRKRVSERAEAVLDTPYYEFPHQPLLEMEPVEECYRAPEINDDFLDNLFKSYVM